LAEAKVSRNFATDRILDELAVALRAEIEATLLIDIVANQIAIGIVETFKDLLDFEQMIAIILEFVRVERIHCCLHLKLDDVTQIFDRVDDALTAVARVMNHPEALD
jgi:hypothetical protein